MNGGSSWPSKELLDDLRETVAQMTRRSSTEVRVVVSPYRICLLGAHIDHQIDQFWGFWEATNYGRFAHGCRRKPEKCNETNGGGLVSAMAINLGILLAFVPSGNSQDEEVNERQLSLFGFCAS